MRLFLKDADFEAFEQIIEQTLETRRMRILSYCLLPNHWHFVLWPQREGDLGAFLQKLTITHARNWQVCRRRVGYGHLYQGRYKSFPIENDEHFYQVARYVERNAKRACLVRRAEYWQFSSLWRRASRRRGGAPGLERWALAVCAIVVAVRQSAADRSGAGSHPPQRASGPTLRRGASGSRDGGEAGPQVIASTARSSQEKEDGPS